MFITVMIPVLLGLLALFLIFLWMIRPGHVDEGARISLQRRSYAHRGLYDNATNRPENSLAAFDWSMQNNYGSELDVQFTKDKKLIVFHDNDYLRACGVDKKVWELTYDEIRDFRLFGSDQKIPLFSEVLETCAGRFPLIVEIKAEGIGLDWYYELSAATVEALKSYRGEYCIESFHPMVVRWLKKNAPKITRGLLVAGCKAEPPAYPWYLAIAIGRLLINFLVRPHFVAYRYDRMCAAFQLCARLGAMTVLWTVPTQAEHDELVHKYDMIIFEHYMPEPRI